MTLSSLQNTSTVKATDNFGVPITPGCTVAHATRRGSGTYIHRLKVESLTISDADGVKIHGYNPDDVYKRRKTLQNLSLVAVIGAADASV